MIRTRCCLALLETPAQQFQRAFDRALDNHWKASQLANWGDSSDPRCLEAVRRAFYDLVDLGIEARRMGNGRPEVTPEHITGSRQDFFAWSLAENSLSSNVYFNRPQSF